MDVRMPDGTIVTNVPDDITQTELARRFNLYKQPEAAPETTFGGHVKEFLKGIPAGAVGLLETAGTGIGALLPEKIEQQGRAAMKENLAGIKESLAPEKGYEESMGRKLGEGLGSTIPFAVAGPLGWAGRAASVGIGGAAGAGEARLRAEAGGASGGERAAATAAGILPGLLDFLPFSAAEKAVGIVRRALIAGGVEGATEAAQEIAQNAIAKGAYNPDQALLEGSGESAGYGGAIGAMAQALVDSALHIKHRGAKTPPPTEEKPKETTAALPHYANPAMVTFPDGTTSSDPADIEAYRQQQIEATKPIPGVNPAGPTAPGAELQGQLLTEGLAPAKAEPQRFTAEDNARLEELVAKRDMTPQEQQEFVYLMVAKDAAKASATEVTTPEATTPEAATPAQVEMDLSSGRTEEQLAAERDAEETKQIEALYEQEANAETEPVLPGEDIRADTAAMEALVPAKGERQARQEQQKVANAERQLRAEEQKLADLEAKMAADVAATDARVAKAQGVKAEPTSAPTPAVAAKPTPVPTPKVDQEIAALQAAGVETPGVAPIEVAPPAAAPAPFKKEPLKTTPRVELQPIEPVVTETPSLSPLKTRAKKATPAKETPSAVAGTKPARVRTSPEGTVGERGKRRATASSAARTEAPKPAGLGTTKRGAVEPTGRKGTPQPAVKETKESPKPAAKKIPAKKGTGAEDATERYVTAASALHGKLAKPDLDLTVSQIEKTHGKKPKNAAELIRMLALRYLAGDIYYASTPDKKTGEYKTLKFGTTNELVEGLGGRFGKAFYNSLSEADQQAVMKEVERLHANEKRGEVEMARLNAMQDLDAALQESLEEGDEKFIRSDAVTLSKSLHPYVQDLLAVGDLVSAMRTISGMVEGASARVAKKLVDVIGDVKVVLDSKMDAAGAFDPKTNTIRINPAEGMNAHTVMHEALHAATSHVLDNKSHPVTKQLQALFNDVKSSLDTAYGAESLDEFVAEAFSNPEFQAKLRSISPKGAPTSAWKQFLNTIKNFVRRMVGLESTGPNTAFDRVDGLVSMILSPSPETRNAGSLYMVSALGKGAEFIDNVIKGRSILPDGPNVDAFHEFLTGTVPKAAKKALMGALPLHAFTDVAESRIPTAETLKRTIELQSSEEHKALESLNESVKDVNRWYRKQTAEVRDVFDRIGPDSSRMQVDPSKDRSKYAGKKDEDGNDLGKAWDSLQADWKKIGPEGQKLYKQMRDTYAKQRDKLQELLGARIDEVVTDKDTAKSLKNEIYARLAKRGGIDPYFPLHREGDYWLMFTGKDPRFGNVEPVVRAFTSKRARDRFIAELKEEGITDIKEYGNFKASNFKDLPPTAFASNVVKTLEASKKVDPEVIDEVMRLYIDLLPESSFAQSFRTRKGTLGYEGSAVDTFRKKTYSIERQMSSMQYGAKYAKIIADTEEHIKAKGSDPASMLLGDELIARAKLAASPKVPKWAKVATSLNFNMFMGLNISSALVNMTQIPLVVAPYLGGKYGLKETTQAIGRATRIVMNSGKDRTIDDYLSTAAKPIKRTIKSYLSIDNYDFKDPALKHLETLARVADARGQLNHSQMQDALDMDSTDTLLGRVNATTGFVFHHAERINRQVSMVAAYELELQKLVGKGKPLSSATKEQMEAAAHEAIFNTEITNGDTAAAAAPRLAQGASGIGKVMFLFKRYGASMYYMLFKTARQALSKTDPETRKAAMKQLAGIYGSSALLAGVRGVPMFGLMAWIFDMFRDDDEDNAATLAQKWMGDTAYKGALNALTGFEISGRVGLSDLIFRDNPYSKDLTPTQALFQTLGGPVLSIADKSFRGFKQIGEGNIERGVEQIMPSAIGNMMKAVRYGTEGTTTLRGDPITGEVGAWNVGGQFFGFAPADYIQQQEINANIKRIDKATNQHRSKLLKQYYIALREGDADGMKDIAEQMQEFSQKHPGARITGETIKNSMAQHRKTSATMYHGITLSKNMRNELMQNVDEYED